MRSRRELQKTWESNLGRIEIEAREDQKKTFYSCLYRAQMFPHRLYELDSTGKAMHYSPYDGKIHEGVLYGDIGIWDAFRTTFPLITILFTPRNSTRFCKDLSTRRRKEGHCRNGPARAIAIA